MESAVRPLAYREMPNIVWRLLTFRLSSDEFQRFSFPAFIVGLVATWVVGMGRWWDDPSAGIWQHLGAGSLIYIFVLSAFLYVFFLPLPWKRWRFFDVLTFVSLTSFPAILYAIPVEMFLPAAMAADLNWIFLGIVAAWRVGMLVLFLRRYAGLSWVSTVIGAGFPLLLVVALLSFLSVLNSVALTMGGVRSRTYRPPPNPLEYVMCPSAIATMGFGLGYLVLLAKGRPAQRPE